MSVIQLKITLRLGKCLHNYKKCNRDDDDDNYLIIMITSFIKRLIGSLIE